MTRAPQTPKTSVKFDDIAGSRPLMHPIDVLGHHRDSWMPLFCSEAIDICPSWGLQARTAARLNFMEFKDLLRIVVESFLAGIFLPAILTPDALAHGRWEHHFPPTSCSGKKKTICHIAGDQLFPCSDTLLKIITTIHAHNNKYPCKAADRSISINTVAMSLFVGKHSTVGQDQDKLKGRGIGRLMSGERSGNAFGRKRHKSGNNRGSRGFEPPAGW